MLIYATNPIAAMFFPALLLIFYLRQDLFVQPCYVYSSITPENDYKDRFKRDMKDPDMDMKIISVAKPGIPTFLAKLMQVANMIEGNYEFLFNKTYL